jgi:phenylalanyl-tRNA synthetase beta chain
MDSAQMQGILNRLHVEAEAGEESGAPGVRVVQPSFRMDLLEEVDAIEELARHYGYDRLELAARAPMLRPAERAPGERIAARLRASLAGRRYHEVVSSSFMDEADPDRLGLAPEDHRRRAVRILNPVVSGAGLLKTSSLPDMLRIVDRNRRRGWTGPIRLFQLDRSFIAREGEALPSEHDGVLLLWAGPATSTHFAAGDRRFSIFDALGELDSLLRVFRLEARRDPQAAESYHRPGGGTGLLLDGKRIGSVGELSPRVGSAFGLDEPVHVAELRLGALTDAIQTGYIFEPFSTYPPVRRDLSLLLPRRVAFERVERLVREGAGELLERFEVFDLYEGEGVPVDCRALGIRLEFRSSKGTLQQKKVDGVLARILASLREQHGVLLRDTTGADALPQASNTD